MIRLFQGPPRTPFEDPREAESAARFGMWLFLIALAALFAATLLGYAVMYVQLSHAGTWPRDLPSVPGSLVLSTLLLAVTSLAIERAARDAGRAAGGPAGDPAVAAAADRARRDLVVAALLGVAFLLLQALSWIDWLRQVSDRLMDSSDHRFALTGFWVLTGLHAIHVLGGALPLALEVWLSRRRPSIDRHRAGTIRFTAMYWHFLGAIWIALYAALLVTI